MTTAQATPKMEPIEALNRLTDIGLAYGRSQMFFTACKLGLFEQLADGPATAAELGERLYIHPEGCRRLLAGLRSLGLVESDGDLFRNSEVGSFLTSRSPVQLEPLSMWGDPFYHMWEFLPEALREYSPRWQQALGTTQTEVFAALYEDPNRMRRFAAMLNAFSVPQGQLLAKVFDFTPHRCVLDVGGGSGGISIQVGLKYPHLRGIIMDLPAVCKVAEEYIQTNGIADRFAAQPGDLFTGPYPAAADVITLSSILHDWNDESGHKILGHCFDALPSGGVLLVTEPALHDDYSGTPFAVECSVHMLVVCEPGARERTESEYRKLIEDAGFPVEKLVRLNAPRDLIVARKP